MDGTTDATDAVCAWLRKSGYWSMLTDVADRAPPADMLDAVSQCVKAEAPELDSDDVQWGLVVQRIAQDAQASFEEE